MKQNLMAETNNVVQCRKLIKGFLNRTRSEQRGLALIYGDPGLGKTRMAEALAFENQWLYLRCQAKSTAKWFLGEVYERISRYVYGAPQTLRGTLAEMEQEIKTLLMDNPQIVMVIDEINLPIQFHKWDVLEMIRDFADETFASFILVGEHNTKALLEGYNKHFFDRCNFFFQFRKLDPADYVTVLNVTSDIDIAEDLMNWMYGETGGNLRKLGKLIEKIEQMARQKGVKSISLKDLGGAA